MMKHILSLALWSVLVFAVSYFGHWTLGMLPGFLIIPIFRTRTLTAFLLGFLSGFLAWGAYAWLLDRRNAHQLSEMIGDLLSISSSPILIIITGIIGGLAIGLSGWLACSLRSANN